MDASAFSPAALVRAGRTPASLALTLLAGALCGCHAHGASGLDHGVSVAFTRSPVSLSTVELSFQNGSPDPVCLSSASFQPSAFVVKTSAGTEGSPATAASTSGCLPLAPGGRISQSVDAGQAHSRLTMQTGSVCYNYAFASASGSAWHAAGQICE